MTSTSSPDPESTVLGASSTASGGSAGVTSTTAIPAEAPVNISCCGGCCKEDSICYSSDDEEGKASYCGKDKTEVGCSGEPTEAPRLACEEEQNTSCCGIDEEGGADCCSGRKESASSSCGGGGEKGGCCDGGESKVQGPCCGCSDDGDSCGGADSCGKQVDEKENLDGDSVCMCCINVLIKEPGLQRQFTDENSASSDPEVPLVPRPRSSLNDSNILDAYTSSLRACCQALVKYCVGRPCCFVSNPAKRRIPSSAVPLSVPSTDPSLPHPEKAATAPIASARGEMLQLEIRGMDCVDCVPKVGRALAQLASVTATNVDHYSGIADLRYDPETISPASIATYVARATGFSVKPLTAASSEATGTVVSLPIRFSTIPPPEAFDGFDTRLGPNPHVIEVSFPVHVSSPRRPRDVLEQFKAFGGELVPAGSDNQRDMATRDLIAVASRTMACAILALPVLVFAWADLPHRPVLYGGISVGLTTMIQALAFPIFSSAVRSVVYLHQADMNVLVSLSTLVAYIFSVVSYACEVSGTHFASPFFETSALLITLIFTGRTISAATRRSTGSALRELQRLQPPDVLLLSDEKTPPESLDSRLLFYGDITRIPPETRIATDGLVIAGSSDADESSVTGESVAVPKEAGSRVIAGTLNLGGTIDVQITRLVHENSLAHITALVRQAGSSRSPIQDFSDRLSAVILPAAAISACIAFLLWALVGRYVRHDSAASSCVNALTYAIAILVVSCPCAIGLAVGVLFTTPFPCALRIALTLVLCLQLPVVTSVAIRMGIREGVLFRSAEVLQTARGIDVIAFDKTGTLTQGNFTMERAEILVKGAEQIVHSLVKDNKHPISQGVYRYLSAHISSAMEHRGGAVVDVVSLPGKGIKASVCGFPLLGGSPSFAGICSHPVASELQASGLTIFAVSLAGQPIAFFGLADTPRPGADTLIAELIRRGKDVMVLSGDTPSAVHHLANAIHISQQSIFAGYTPEDKGVAIAALQAKGKRVCFIGDGTNDGPALSRADIGLAMAAGSDVALTAAGGVLLGSDLHRGVLAFFDIATAAQLHTRLALVWCVLYAISAILLASGALVKFRIEPRWAGIGEVVSIAPVLAIAFMLDVYWTRRSSG